MSFQREQLQYGQLPLNFFIAELFSIYSYVAASLVSRLSPCVAAQVHCL